MQYSALSSLAIAVTMTLLASQLHVAYAIDPNYRTDRQIHGVLTQGNRGAVQEIKTTLTNQADVTWAKSYIAEMVLTWDSFTDSSVGAGWVHMRLPNDNIQSTSAVYYHNADTGLTGLTFFGDLSGSSFIATTLRGSYDSTNDCWNWSRTVGSFSETRCIQDFDNGYGEVWSTSASGSNTFGSVTEYASMQYKITSGGSWTNWSSAGGSIYCHDGGPFITNQNTNWNAWNVSPPGSGTACSGSSFTSPKELP